MMSSCGFTLTVSPAPPPLTGSSSPDITASGQPAARLQGASSAGCKRKREWEQERERERLPRSSAPPHPPRSRRLVPGKLAQKA
mmetsp:Transcript_128688/g.274689  ORF Transcript_128688/g.274689 Transcript_128688/m.274689 type:complete len:84 (+) Transcript_128688:1848-2099(+)